VVVAWLKLPTILHSLNLRSLSCVAYPTFPISSSSCVDDMTSQGALVHHISIVLPSNSTALTDFFNHYGILDLVDFMSLDEVDFKETYSNTVSESNHLSPILVKNFYLFNPGMLHRCLSFLVFLKTLIHSF
jgi:hypothetical protein